MSQKISAGLKEAIADIQARYPNTLARLRRAELEESVRDWLKEPAIKAAVHKPLSHKDE